MNTITKLFIVAAATGSSIAFYQVSAQQGADRPAASLERGQKLYLQNCAGCHGNEGRGDGLAAAYLNPKPRDFSTATFKLTSTPQGSLPTDDDLFRTITNGMPGSAMPSWELLPEADRRSVVTFIKTLVKFYDEDEKKWINKFDLEDNLTPIVVPPEPPKTLESIARGKMVFRKAECFKCHGDGGRGDGLTAPTLKDSWGYSIRPRDFTAGIFKGGNDPQELYKRITIGLNGTPMPSHEQALAASERWDLVHFVQSLGRPGAQEMTRQVRKTVAARRVAASDDWTNPRSELWNKENDTYIALMPLWWRENHTEGVLVKSVHDGDRIYMHLSWEDATMNNSVVRSEDFRDGAAIQFARTPDAPFIAMGAGVEDVNIWLWKAERNGGPAALAETHTQYPNYDVLDYPEMLGWKPGDADAAKRTMRDLGPRFAAGWAAGNPVSDPTVKSPVENLAAHGFSTLSHLRPAMEHVDGKGFYDRGTWSIVLWRTFATVDATEAPLAPGKHIPAAFAIWDGAAGDRNGQKSITIWQDLEIQR